MASLDIAAKIEVKVLLFPAKILFLFIFQCVESRISETKPSQSKQDIAQVSVKDVVDCISYIENYIYQAINHIVTFT